MERVWEPFDQERRQEVPWAGEAFRRQEASGDRQQGQRQEAERRLVQEGRQEGVRQGRPEPSGAYRQEGHRPFQGAGQEEAFLHQEAGRRQEAGRQGHP
jgi:hypothetical protein